MVRPVPSTPRLQEPAPREQPVPAPPAPAGAAEPAATLPRLAIVGTPGSGKTLLFQSLTGARAGAAPLTTTSIESAALKLPEGQVLLLDTPGSSGFEHCSEHELVTRRLLREQPPQLLIQCVRADQLIRSLMLTAELADLEIPMVICLTMVEEALARGQLIDAEALGRQLGVPVVAVCSLDGRGLRRLLEVLPRAQVLPQVAYPGAVQARLDDLTPLASRAHRLERLLAARQGGQAPGQSLWHMIQEAHRHWAGEAAARATRSTGLEPRPSLWAWLAEAALHPVWAWLFLLVTLLAVYFLISRVGVSLLAGNLERHLAEPIIAGVGALTGPGWLREALVGPFGLLSLGLLNALCTILPILLVFHLAFCFLEEVGYFPLLSVQLDRLLRSIGLTGKAVLPMTLGFGCNSLAVQATRCLDSPRQRLIASFLVALSVPCAIQLGVLTAILSSLPAFALLAFLCIVLGVSMLAGRALAWLLPRGERGEFLIELRPLRSPRPAVVLARTGQRLREFFRELLPLFLAAAAVLQLLEWSGALRRLRQLLEPLLGWALGLPASMADVLLMALARREVAALMLKKMADSGQLDLQQVLVGLLVLTLFVPCLNTLLVLGRVLGVLRAALIFFSVMLAALAVGSAVNLLWPGH